MKYTILCIVFLMFSKLAFGGTRVAYTRPGMMMRIPTSSNKVSPYLFRTGFSTEIHNFNPFNTAGGLFFDMEISRGFSFGFSAVVPGDTSHVKELPNGTLLKSQHIILLLNLDFIFSNEYIHIMISHCLWDFKTLFLKVNKHQTKF